MLGLKQIHVSSSGPKVAGSMGLVYVHIPFWESVGMRRGFASIFGIWTIFLPPKIWPCLPFYSDLVGSHFEAPHFQHVDDLFASKFDQIYHFIQILLGPSWTSSGAPLLILTQSAPPPPPPPLGSYSSLSVKSETRRSPSAPSHGLMVSAEILLQYVDIRGASHLGLNP